MNTSGTIIMIILNIIVRKITFKNSCVYSVKFHLPLIKKTSNQNGQVLKLCKCKCNSCTFPADRLINTMAVGADGPFKWPNVFHMNKNNAPVIILKLLSFLRDILD